MSSLKNCILKKRTICIQLQSALMDMTYLAIDKMRKDKGGNGGCVINISSGAGIFMSCSLFVCTSKIMLKLKNDDFPPD